jgi:hypothetical protein
MNSNRRTRFFAAGVIVLIVGLLAAVGLWYSAGQRQSEAVRNLARAPVGCDTTLNFEVAGEFLVFVEIEGKIGNVTGSCESPGDFGQLGISQGLPPVRLDLTAPDGSDVALDTRTGVDYDADGSAGQAIRTFVVERPGDYVLRVQPANDAEPAVFAIAIGRDPSDGVRPLQLGAFAAGIAGLIIGLALIATSRRRDDPEGMAPIDPWLVAAPWPISPPGAAQLPQAGGWQQQPGPPMQTPSNLVQPPFTTPTGPSSAPSSWAPPEMPSE